MFLPSTPFDVPFSIQMHDNFESEGSGLPSRFNLKLEIVKIFPVETILRLCIAFRYLVPQNVILL